MLEGTSIIFMFLCTISSGVYWDVPQALSTKERWVQSFSHPLMGVKNVFSHASRKKSNKHNKTGERL